MRAQADYPFVTAAIEIFADWWKQRRDRKHELGFLAKSKLEGIARAISG